MYAQDITKLSLFSLSLNILLVLEKDSAEHWELLNDSDIFIWVEKMTVTLALCLVYTGPLSFSKVN